MQPKSIIYLNLFVFILKYRQSNYVMSMKNNKFSIYIWLGLFPDHMVLLTLFTFVCESKLYVDKS